MLLIAQGKAPIYTEEEKTAVDKHNELVVGVGMT